MIEDLMADIGMIVKRDEDLIYSEEVLLSGSNNDSPIKLIEVPKDDLLSDALSYGLNSEVSPVDNQLFESLLLPSSFSDLLDDQDGCCHGNSMVIDQEEEDYLLQDHSGRINLHVH